MTKLIAVDIKVSSDVKIKTTNGLGYSKVIECVGEGHKVRLVSDRFGKVFRM